MTRKNRLTAGPGASSPKGERRALPPARARRASVPEGEAPVCKYRKVQVPGDVDVEALIRSLETRNASKRAPEPAEPGEPISAAPASAATAPESPEGGAPGARMADADLDEIARVLKSSRSIASARQSGLRLLVEAMRARDEEKRLAGKA